MDQHRLQILQGQQPVLEARHREISQEVKAGSGLKVNALEYEYLLAANAFQTAELRRRIRLEKLELMRLMGLVGTLEVADRLQLIAPNLQHNDGDESTENLILEALKSRLELKVADLGTQQSEEQIRLALSGFLPRIGVQGIYSRSSNSFLRYADNLLLGAGLFLSVFEGFRSITEYRQALRMRKLSLVERESRCVAVILEVLRARELYRQAKENLELADKRLQLAQARLAQVKAQIKAGTVPPSVEKQAQAELIMARETLMVTRCVRFLGRLVLNQSLGRSILDSAGKRTQTNPRPQPSRKEKDDRQK